MTMNEYQRLASRTINKELDGHQLLDHALWGLGSESGEIQGIFQKSLQGHPIDDSKLKEELGDLLWFCAEFATVNGWRLADVANCNIAKLVKRYPEGFEKERSVNRDKYEND